MNLTPAGKLERAMRIAAKFWARDSSWKQASAASGVGVATLRNWNNPAIHSPQAERWREILAEAEAEVALGGPPAEVVSTEGFKTPEAFCDHWSLEAAKVQVQTMVDPDAARRDRLDASKFVAALGGHTPISKAVVIAAPIDERLAAQIVGAIALTKQAGEAAQLSLPDYTTDEGAQHA